MRAERRRIYDKTQGRCAYCGKPLPEKGWHIDHVLPIYRGYVRAEFAGENDDSNKIAACARCNRFKATFTIDELRHELGQQITRLRRDSRAFRLAEDFGLVQPTGAPIVFYYERIGIELTTNRRSLRPQHPTGGQEDD